MTTEPTTLDSTLVLIKPDAVQRGLVGTILTRLEARGLLIRAIRSFVFTDELVREHYAHLAGRSFFPDVAAFMKSGMTVAVWVSGVDAVDVVRGMVGATNAREAMPGTIRGDLAVSTQRNLIHASDAPDSAKAELARFFPDGPSAPADPAAVRAAYSQAEAA